MDKKIVEKFKNYFTQMDLGNDSVLDEIYSDNVEFIDPIHNITGIEKLREYFKKLDESLVGGSFLFIDESIVGNKAYLSWEMDLKLKRPKKNVKASRISVLIIEEKVIKQRDFFDAGELFYENVPILGGVIRFLKRKIAS